MAANELKYPRGEHVWTGYYNNKKELLYIITSKEARDYYYLYEATESGFKKLGKSRNPLELVEKHSVYAKMRG